MKRKDPLKILTNQTKANVSFLMMSSPNGTISSNVALSRRKLRKLLFTHYLNVYFAICASQTLQKSSAIQKISGVSLSLRKTLSSVIIAKFFSFFVFIYYKATKNFANYQIFNGLYFIELTLIYIRLVHLTARFIQFIIYFCDF